jgi:hypothetical protein
MEHSPITDAAVRFLNSLRLQAYRLPEQVPRRHRILVGYGAYGDIILEYERGVWGYTTPIYPARCTPAQVMVIRVAFHTRTINWREIRSMAAILMEVQRYLPRPRLI